MAEHIVKLTQSMAPVNAERYSCACLYCKSGYRPQVMPDLAAHASLVLDEDVFVVSGAKNHCLYDLRQGMLYWLDDQALVALRKLKDGGSAETEGEEEAARFIKEAQWPLKPYGTPAVSSPIAPSFGLLQATDRCNLKCIHCYEDAKYDTKDYNTLSLADAIYAMDEMDSVGVRHLQITGGEPLLNPDIKAITTYACKKFDTVEFYSNCLLMTDEMAAMLKALGATVALSMYSYDGMNHDFVTLGRRSHERTSHAIDILQNHGLTYRISTILLDGIDLGQRNNAPFDLAQKQDVVRLVGRAGITLLDEKTIDRKFITKATFQSRLNREDVRYNMACHNCFGYTLYVSALLEVTPCPMEKRFSHGSMAARTPGLLSQLLKPDILHMTKDLIKGCKDCEYRYACFDCRPDSMGRPVDAKPWNCAYDPYKGTWEEDIAEKVVELKQAVKDEIIASV